MAPPSNYEENLDHDGDNEQEDSPEVGLVSEDGGDNEQDEGDDDVKDLEASASHRRRNQASAATQDEKLKAFLANADEIESVEHFTYWKDEFLATFRQYLDPQGTATAREADEEIYSRLERLVKVCLDVKQMVKDGKITVDHSSVKGQRAMSEMFTCLATVEGQINCYWPKTQEDEEICGYTKFELAAVLVRDGFRVYGLMVATRDYVNNLAQGPLKDIIKPNQMSIIQFYFRCLQSFTQTMADLGMYKLMQKCVEIYKVRPRKKKKKKFNRAEKDALSDSSDSDTINNGRMFRRSKNKFRSIMDHGWTSGVNRTQVKAPDEGITKKKGPGVSGRKENNENDPDTLSEEKEENDLETNEDEEEEEEEIDYIYYFDPVSETVGKVPRAQCVTEKIIFTKDPDGNEKAEGVIEEWDSKDGKEGKAEIIWKLKQLLRGNPEKKAEGLVSPQHPEKKRGTPT